MGLTPREVLDASALTQARWIASGALSSVQLTRLYLDRIDRHDAVLSSFVQVLSERALYEARCYDEAGPDPKQPFRGVPIGVKDLSAARGSFMRMGSPAFSRLYSPFDDVTVRMLRRGGFVILGKTSTSELGTLPVTEPPTHPPTRNPWDTDVTPGGSSGGAGAAAAADLIPLAIGSDAGGSIRIPSALCGLFGLKPSRAIVPNPFGLDRSDIIWSCGPMTRFSEDAAALFDVLCTPQSRQSLAAPSTSRLQVRVTTESELVVAEPAIQAAVLQVARLLEDMGHEVQPAPRLGGVTTEEFLPIWQLQTSRVPVADWSLTGPVTRWLGEAGLTLAPDVVSAKQREIASKVLERFGDADLWVTPTVAVSPPAIGAWSGLAPRDVFEQAAKLAVFTAPFNLSGQPAISCPIGFSPAGHPIGVQLVARHGQDLLLLRLAAALETEFRFPEQRQQRASRQSWGVA